MFFTNSKVTKIRIFQIFIPLKGWFSKWGWRGVDKFSRYSVGGSQHNHARKLFSITQEREKLIYEVFDPLKGVVFRIEKKWRIFPGILGVKS